MLGHQVEGMPQMLIWEFWLCAPTSPLRAVARVRPFRSGSPPRLPGCSSWLSALSHVQSPGGSVLGKVVYVCPQAHLCSVLVTQGQHIWS